MADKTTQIANVADEVIKRYKDDVFERFRVLYRVELRPFQWEWFFLMDKYPEIIAKACPRVGKTFCIQMKHLDENLIHPDENEMVFAPKLDQAVNTRKIQNDVIEKSDVLKAYLKRSAQGKPEFGQASYEFYNRSTSKCFGCLGNFEGENATKEHVDELDDIPPVQLKRIIGRATGANKNGLPTRLRFSGVKWGRLNIWKYETEGQFYILPPMEVYLALSNNYLDPRTVMLERQEMTDEEWLVTWCLLDVEVRNFIWSSRLHFSQMLGLNWDVYPIPPGPMIMSRPPDSRIAFGLDMGAQGSGEDSSDYSLQVTMSQGHYRRWIWGKTWPGTTDPETIINDVCSYWQFYRPNGGFADALDANLVAQINTRMYELGLVNHDWHRLGDNAMEGWGRWARKGLLTPINNSGRTKHHMYTTLKACIDNCLQVNKDNVGRIFVFPMIDRHKAQHLEHWKEVQILIRELENLTAERTQSGYLKIERIKKKIDDPVLQMSGSRKLGDDRADALAMSNYFLDYLDPKLNAGNWQTVYVRGI